MRVETDVSGTVETNAMRTTGIDGFASPQNVS